MSRNVYTLRALSTVIIVVAIVGVIYALTALRAENSAEQMQKINFDQLEERTSSPDNLRVRDGVIPATNRWFSSLVFGDEPTVFAYPFSYKARSDGFEVSVPKVTSTENAVFAPHTPAISVELGSDAFQVSDYDDVTVRNSFLSESGNSVADVLLAQGHPYVYVTATSDIDITIRTNGVRDTSVRENGEVSLFTVNDQQYGIRAQDLTQTGEVFQIALKAGNTATIFAIPDGSNSVDSFVSASNNRVIGSKVGYENQASKIVTTIGLETEKGTETISGNLPHHGIPANENQLGSFNTLYGKLTMNQGNTITYKTSEKAPDKKLDLSNVSDARKEELREYLNTDVESLSLNKTDTYFGFKELYKASQLLLLADQLGATDQKGQIQSQLKNAVTAWLIESDGRAERLFYYDTTLKGVVGVEPSFGSEEFNDHHFHYGYFIYAASVLADYDTSFVEEYGDIVDLIVADIAAENVEGLPDLRTYDRFTGHSWASGFANFADGNNQESSSEAVNAWAAVYHWAKTTDNTNLADRASWLYANEINATNKYWLNDQRNNAGFNQYAAPFVSLVWNGKRDYATFFSPRPQAMLGIQLIPMSPAHQYLERTDIPKNLNHVQPDEANYSGQFGDYLLMYKALSDSAVAIKQLSSISDDQIDDGNSKSYMYAWVYSQGNTSN